MSIYVLSALARSRVTHAVLSLVLQGRVGAATSAAESLLESRAGVADDPAVAELALLCGDLMLAQDRDEEAEEMYRRAVRAAAHAPRGQVRVVSCRGTGLLSLYQQRFGTAAACFRRIVEDPAATVAQKVEALGALALAHHGMGQTSQAVLALDEAAEAAAEADAPAAAGIAAPLATFVSLLRVDLMVRREIRAHATLRDHVFWQSAPSGNARARVLTEPLAAIDACLSAHGGHVLIAERLRHQRALVLATCGDAAAMPSLQRHLTWLRGAGLACVERQARLETALVAIVVRNAEMARSLLEPLCGRSGDGAGQRWNVELSYCLAKVAALDGRTDESMQHYQRYALQSVQCLRTEAPNSVHGARGALPTESSVKDDVEMSLPAKYRRAYRYLLDHLDCAALSIREIAEHVGVTERALQSVFRTHLGMTPVEVLRRCRVERIHDDLINDDASQSTVIQTAARWGIRNRSTLVAAYRRYFSETPAETLSRRGDGQAAGARQVALA